MNQYESMQANAPQLNERLWQAWLVKNRELDKARSAKAVRLLQAALAMAAIAAVVHHFIA
jgi:hypothetical protein